MEQKVSAKELMDVVTDTNKKVTAMARGQRVKADEEQNYSAFGTVMAILFIILGVALVVAAIFQQVAGTDITFFFHETVWSFVYAGYATAALVILSITHIHPAVRLIALLAAFSPLCISFLVPVF